MRAAPSIVGGLWIAFAVCWLVLAQFNKKASRGSPWGSALGMRLIVIAAVILLLLRQQHRAAGHLISLRHALRLHSGIAVQWLGVGLCLVGFGLAFWARAYLGRNWGMPMSLRQGHELVTSGPYAYVRHPIYTGIMLAMIGSALTVNVFWLLLLVVYFTYFIISARTEEKMMREQFPDAYPAYQRRTRMLIPFIF